MRKSKMCRDRSKPAAVLITLVAVLAAEGAPPKTQYEQFVALSPEHRQKMVRRYVRRKGEFWTVTRGIYTVNSTVTPQKTLEYAIFMRDFASRIDRFFQVKPKGRFKPVIYLCRDKDTMKDLMWEHFMKRSAGTLPDWAHGLYVPHLQALYILEDENTKEFLLHEGTHQFMHYLLGPKYRHLPIWINEGLATNFQTWDLTGTTRDNLEKCAERSDLRFVIPEMLKEKPMPLTLKRLMAKDHLTWSSAQGKQVAYQYALAWSFTDYLLNTDDGKLLLKKVCGWAYSGKKNARIPKPVLKRHREKWEKYVKHASGRAE